MLSRKTVYLTKSYIIYKYTSPSGKHYIGQTCRPVTRKWEHRQADENSYFHNAINKHGYENFTYEVLERDLTLDEANERESYYIREYNSMNRDKGYNRDTGGSNGSPSEETREKLRQANLGKKASEETRLKISNALKGKPKSENARANMSEAQKGNKNCLGVKKSEEAKLKISETQGTKIRINDVTFSSITKAGLGVGKSKSYISRIINGDRTNPNDYKIEILVDNEWVDYRTQLKENLLNGEN